MPGIERLRALRSRWTQHKVLGSAGTLVLGTVAGQAIGIAALPFLTRLYSPTEFKIFAAFLSAHNIISVMACLRWDVAITVAPEDDDAKRLFLLAIIAATTTAVLLGLVGIIAGAPLLAAVNLPLLTPYFWLLPISIWLAGVYSAAQFWATRRRNYARIAGTRVWQSGSGALAQLGLGLFKAGPMGLILGQLLIAGAGAVGLVRQALGESWEQGLADGRRGLVATARAFRRFPQYSTLEAFANRGSAELPLLVIAALVAGPEAGFVLLAVKVIGAPISLVGNAVTQVFMSDARVHHGQGSLTTYVERTIAVLATIGSGPVLLAGIVAPQAFAWIFGPEWIRAGEIVSWMTAWSLLKFITSPISGVLHVQMRQRAMALLQAFGLIVRVGCTATAALFRPEWTAETFSVVSAIFYFACLIAYASAAQVNWRRLARVVPAIAGSALVGAVAGLAVANSGALL